MSLMSRGAGARDHRGIAKSTDTGPKRPDQAAAAPPSAAAPTAAAPTAATAAPPSAPPAQETSPPGWWSGRHPGAWDGPGWDVWGRHNAGTRRHGRRHGHRFGSLRRDPDARVLAGICSGFSQASGIDVTVVRIGFVLLALFSGIGVVVYAVGWLLLPLQGENSNIFSRAIRDRRGIRLLVAVVPVLVVTQIVTSSLHIGYTGSFLWPVFLAAGAAVLIWRNVSEQERDWIHDDIVPMLRTGEGLHNRRTLVTRVGLGALLGLAGLLVLVLGHTSQAALRPVGGALLVIAAIVVIFGPWWISLVRDLMAERQARALAEERSQMAAHVHDSVLQTLALIQRSADDPQHVVRLARTQERELRSWLFEGRPPGTFSDDATTLAEGVDVLQRQVEEAHGIEVQVVLVGDCPLTDALRALLDAAREATVNAAKWSGAPQVSLYAEVEARVVMLFVRDRGHGFDPSEVPEDRQGIARSIRARMSRFGGSADIRSAPGQGAEVELSMPRAEAVQ
jgi:signal transduction histidine kinase/phage shock protein PspC (stress-responsive transcriptional regulator)